MQPVLPRYRVTPDAAPLRPLGPVWTVVVVAGVAATAPALAGTVPVGSLPPAFWVMAALAVVVDAWPFTPADRRYGGTVLPSVCLTFAILLAWGAGPAMVVQAVAVLAACWRHRRSPARVVFDIARFALAFAVADGVLLLAGGTAFALGARPQPTDVAWAVAAAAAWFALRYGIVAAAVRLRGGHRQWAAVRRGLVFELLSTGSLLLLSPVLLAGALASPALIALVVVPLYGLHRMVRLFAEHEQLARLDPLTGLANRKALLGEAADQAARHAARRALGFADHHLVLLLLDLDGFKHVNDALGHAVGDRLLVAVADRLAGAVGPQELVARLGGDEFAVLAPRLDGPEAARRLADRLAAALREPVSLDGLPLDVDASIGVALYPQHGEDFVTLMRHAEVAMYEAKQRGDAIVLYTPESDHSSPERLSLLADLRRTLESDPGSGGADDPGEITMYYQPQVAIGTGEVIGVEALLRWRHPRRGMVGPAELIRVAEQTAVMRLLTRRVVDDVVRQLAGWAAVGINVRAALNVSVRDLHTGEIVDQIETLLAEHGLPASRLQIEITEGALMADPHRVLATIARLDRLGIAIALDDFGTGYSSLQHLRRLPLAEVKVDRSFVLGMSTDADDAAIVRSIIDLAGALGLRVVAEGVEDERTWRLLHAAGCHAAQGWFHARPMPPAELVDWLARYRPTVLTPAVPGGAAPRLRAATSG
ncbi:MAG TPA: EAL domain-containing protein [Catenuloplanes sp.]|jgi:diguanylate cyclase (GGDEF)-like protein